MPVTTRGITRIWHKRDRKAAFLNLAIWLIVLIAALYCWQIISNVTYWPFALTAPQEARRLITRMFPPNWAFTSRILKPLWDTLNIATLGTALAIIGAVPMAFLAARNTTPHPILRPVALVLIVASRSVNSLIWALLLVAVLGPGILAGILAIALRSVGFIGKLLFEAIEEIDAKQVEAITATGAERLKVLTYGVIPQILPAFSGISVYRWDINIRESAVVGLVGAGGIGIQLNGAILGSRWDNVVIILMAIFLLVLISEWVSARVRGAVT
jgi:phosphonate transport system permease protein